MLFNFFAKRDFCRLAAFLWIRPLLAALSNFFDATMNASCAFSTSFNSTSASNFLMAVRMADFIEALWARRFSLVFARLIADLMFATSVHLRYRSDFCSEQEQVLFYQTCFDYARVFKQKSFTKYE